MIVSADGVLPGEGAAAVVIKRLDRAIADGDRVYAVVKGIGSASGGGVDTDLPSKEAYVRSLNRCYRDAEIAPSTISYLETHGSGRPAEDNLESVALHEFMENQNAACAIGSVKANIGHTGAAAALASVVKTGLSLYHEIIPPLINFTEPGNSIWHQNKFHFPVYPQYWLRNRKDGVRNAMVGSMTGDGNCMHVILSGFDYETEPGVNANVVQKVRQERKRPQGLQPLGLFAVEGQDKKSLLSDLDSLYQHTEKHLTGLGAEDDDGRGGAVETAARAWYLKNGVNPKYPYALTIVTDDLSKLKTRIIEAREISGIVYPA